MTKILKSIKQKCLANNNSHFTVMAKSDAMTGNTKKYTFWGFGRKSVVNRKKLYNIFCKNFQLIIASLE